MENGIIRKIKELLSDDSTITQDEVISYIKKNISKVSYDSFLAQKLLWKILGNNALSDDQKIALVQDIQKQYPTEMISNLALFTDYVMNKFRKVNDTIKETIRKNFDSIFMFMTCLNQFSLMRGGLVRYPKDILIKNAFAIWGNIDCKDEYNLILIPDAIVIEKVHVLEVVYLLAMEIGCMYERYEAISYLSEEILATDFKDGKMVFEIGIKDIDYSYGIKLGSEYNLLAWSKRAEKTIPEPEIFEYNKCYVCKKCFIMNIAADEKEWIISMVKNQLTSETYLDFLICRSKKYQTGIYLVSVLLYLYIEYLFVILLSNQGYGVIQINDIKRNCCFGKDMSNMDFQRILEFIGIQDSYKFIGMDRPYFKVKSQIYLFSSLFDTDYNIFEDLRDIIFNQRKSELGEEVNYFGKSVLETCVKQRFRCSGWTALSSSIKVKNTDFALVAWKDGKVILGQVKTAHSGRKPYQLWKAFKTIEKANIQISRCKEAITKDENLLFSNLKREKLVQSRHEIKEIIYMIITGTSYFSMSSDVAVISIEDISNILTLERNNPEEFMDVIMNPISMYSLDRIPEIHDSLLDFDDVQIIYEDLDE